MEAGMTMRSFVLCASVAALSGLLAGCRVEKTTNGDSKDVKIVTPFGGMNVKTNDADALAGIDLPAYPGAVAVKKDSGNDDNHSANVDMSFGGFKLKVKVAAFRTDDSPDKVESFYRDGMKRFGDVIVCKNNQPIGSPAKTGEGLTCDNKHGGHVSVNNDTSNHLMELKAGSEQHQHLVTMDQDGGGTKFSLVVLDLPGKISYDGDVDSDKRQ
jgi:predicted small secreted protein